MVQKIKSLLKNDVVERAVKTFVQAVIATLLAGYATVDSVETGKALVVGAVAAGISAAWNSIKK